MCGLEQAFGYLEDLRFEDDSLSYLSSLGLFTDEFLSFLGGLSFTGKIWAVPEGETVFASEPLIRVTAPIIEAQIVESFLMNCITFQTMVASKAARVAVACGDRQFVDYSLRRDHGADAGLKAARASFIAGASATSNVLAGKLYGIPVSGTMAHSYVMAFESEISAFRAYARAFGDRTILLIDTFDVEDGARNAAIVAKETEARGTRIKGVRIDSGDLASLTRSVRKILDEAGLDYVQIVLSGDLDEFHIRCWTQGFRPMRSASERSLAPAVTPPRWEALTSSSRTSAAPASSSRPARQRPRGESRSTASLEGVSPTT